jgi:putative NADH-flavin reductase
MAIPHNRALRSLNWKEEITVNITIFGATGKVGSRVIAEAVSRGHSVTAVARKTDRPNALPDAADFQTGDIGNIDDVISLSEGRDVVINATRPADPQDAVQTNREFMNGLAETQVRALIVGGAASLLIPGMDGKTVLDDPRYLSPAFRHVGEASLAQYRAYIDESRVNWTYLSPPASLFAGSRTGDYRLGTDELLLDEEGKSRLSMEDLAVVLLDEAERPRHQLMRFTAAY